MPSPDRYSWPAGPQFRTIHRLLFQFAKSIAMPALISKRPSAALGEIRRELDRRRKLAAVAKGRIMKKSSASAPPMIPTGATAAAIMQKMAIPRKPAGAAIKKPSMPRPRAPAIAYVPLEEAPKRCTAPKGRPTPFGIGMNANMGIKKSPAPIPHEQAGAAIKKSILPTPHKPADAPTKKSSTPISRATPPLVTSSPASEPIQIGTKVCVRTVMGTMPSGLRLFIWLSAVVVSDAEEGYFDVMYDGDFPRDNPFRDVRVARDQVKKMPSSRH